MNLVKEMNEKFILICMGFFIIIMILSCYWFEENPSYVKSEEVMYKDISHISNFGNDVTYYNIYTKYNKFEISLDDYNEIDVGDNLTVSYNNQSFIPYTYYNNNMYFSE